MTTAKTAGPEPPGPDLAETLLAHVWKPHEGQREFLDADAGTRVLACGRRWGKTEACAADLFLRLVRAAETPGAKPERALIVAPSLDQARMSLDTLAAWIAELVALEAWPFEPPTVKERPHPTLRLGAHSVTARSGSLPRLLRGGGATHIVVDEAAFLPDATITDVLLPMLATGNGRLTLVSTPNGRNLFARMWDTALRAMMGEPFDDPGDENDPTRPDPRTLYWCKNARSADNPNVGAHFLRQRRSEMTERGFEVEYEAKFHDAPGAAFRGRDVDAAIAADPAPLPTNPVVIGVDWARTGDATAFVVLGGYRGAARVLELQRHHNLPFLEQRDRLADLLKRYPAASVYADDTGLGSPLNELLNDPGSSFALKGTKVKRVVFSKRSKADLVANLQIALERRELALPSDPQLRRELLNYAQVTTPSGHIGHAAAAGTDDLVSALMLAVAHLSTNSALSLVVPVPRNR